MAVESQLEKHGDTVRIVIPKGPLAPDGAALSLNHLLDDTAPSAVKLVFFFMAH